ncbi:MAG TPA: LysR family transcriptional regulator [Gammaproteobacteria bacterium]|nr:LysR family transcriptional regulator [Gammaproteobacteria bacterium]
MNIKSLDLNLLVALKALLDEQHVTRAADRIGLSQPAMSRALGRLRVMFRDPLLVKSAKGLCLTPKAKELYRPLKTILTDVVQLVSPTSFELGVVEKEIVIATRDYESTVLIPGIINTISKQAPHLSFRIIPLVGDDLSFLESQEVDFVIAGSDSQATTLCRYTLYKEKIICLISKNNAIRHEKLTLKKFLEMKHCLADIRGGDKSIIDDTLQKKKLKRNIIVRIPHFLTAANVVANSDMIMTLPYRLGMFLLQQDRYILLEPPIKLPELPIYLYWHLRNQHNPLNQWLRKMIREFVNEKSSQGQA